MKIFLKSFILLLFLGLSSNQMAAQGFDYAYQFGSSSSSLEQGEVLAIDDTGNVYLAGQFAGTTDFDPGAGVFQLAPNGSNGFIAKYDSLGAFVWAKMFDEGLIGGSIRFRDIKLDNRGNILLTGNFSGQIDFNPGSATNFITHYGSGDLFVAKLDASGNYIWAEQFGGTSSEEGRGLVVDSADNIYIAGYFSGAFAWKPISISNIITGQGIDGVVFKLDSTGAMQWVEKLGGSGTDEIKALKMDAQGDLYMTGSFQNTADFNPGSGTFNMNAGNFNSAFIWKLDQSSNFIWAKAFKGDNNVDPYDLEIGPSGDIYSVGVFLDSTDFDPSSNSVILSNDAVWSSYISKLNSNGDFIWTKKIEGQGGIHPNALYCDDNNFLHIAGFFGVELDLYPGTPSLRVPTAGFADIFYLKLDTAGQFCTMRNFGAAGLDVAEDLIVDKSNKIYITGTFARTVDFDAGPGVANLTSINQQSDIFLLKLDPNNCPIQIQDSIVACDSTLWINGQTISKSSNSEVGLIVGANNLDTLVLLNAVINKSSFSTDSIIACDSILWIDGNTYTSSDTTAQYLMTSSSGCDSTITLNLKIKAKGSTETITSCDQYTWTNGITYFASTTATDTLINSLGCDSILSLNLTINSSSITTDSVSSCTPFTWINGVTYFLSTSTPKDTLLNILGCDSIISLALEINSIDTSLVARNDSLIANELNGSYQWLHCDFNFGVIPGATNRSFSPLTGGNYAVEITNSAGCIDTSSCRLIQGVSIEESALYKVQVYPNPTNGKLSIVLAQALPTDLRIYSTDGKIVYESSKITSSSISLDLDLKAGLYFLEISNDQFPKGHQMKLIIEK